MVRRRRERDRSRVERVNTSGCARTEGWVSKSVASEGGSKPKGEKYVLWLRLLCLWWRLLLTTPCGGLCYWCCRSLMARSAAVDESSEGGGGGAGGGAGASNRSARITSLAAMYRELKAEPLWKRLRVLRSEIHGFGLYLLRPIPKDGAFGGALCICCGA